MFCTLAQLSPRVYGIDQVLSPYVYVFYASFIVAFVFTPIMRMVAIHYNIVDNPDRLRKMHQSPVAYLGGIAIFLGLLAGLAISQYLSLHRSEPGWPSPHPGIKFSIVLGALIIVLLGLWDDLLGVRPTGKIIGQVAVAILLLLDDVGSQCTRSLLENLLMKIFQLIGPVDSSGAAIGPDLVNSTWFQPLVYVTSSLLVVVVVVGCCNATNLMDGLDGLCGGVTAIIAFGFVFIAVHLAMYGGGLNTNWDALRVILGLAILGAVLGFVPYNFNPASIFMGDAGSMLLGFVCAVMIILMAQERPKWFLAAMVMFALPVLDTTLAFARRWIAGRPLFSADAQHFHHQLVQRGFTVKQTVLISYGLAVFFALLGATIVFIRTRYSVAIYLVTFGSIVVAAYKIGMVHERPRGGRPSTLEDATTNRNTEVVNSGEAFEVQGKTAVTADTGGIGSGGSEAGSASRDTADPAVHRQASIPPAA
ncbi:glycosyltransferase family 4 protein [Humisphaera borealis]|uniref:Undecaprenyl/decaprenyl-phosphate alpha-N-acetylglucosaminyl 1-phosphate transferase n=1 Tax=Humisphaera borealis TaxID=2807512 RepID=A0A7M2X390_9BACT|nr:MraY family glycosyltransferase [Humisphaera borealis]QOV92144.1 undecaprenyl/decaprenyl-phosphate alpha-N-acetylglucosaminyl 1-phosphate transferase [Humisphaera borealis]